MHVTGDDDGGDYAGNSGMKTLVENVDRSAIVLIFLSNRLKNSAACRSGMSCTTHWVTLLFGLVFR